jgi:hypothetical protein
VLTGLDRLVGHLAGVAGVAGPDGPDGRAVDLDPVALLAGRAALLGLTRQGSRSAGGACRLLAVTDGWVAVSLARPEDVELVPALIGPGGDPSVVGSTGPSWGALARAARTLPGHELVGRARELGLPAGVVPTSPAPGPAPPVVLPLGRSGPAGSAVRPLVIDLSSLWAGPLCARVLSDTGARVIKVESTGRPDAGRSGCPPLFDWLHAGHESVVLDFDSRPDRAVLVGLLSRADVVIEGSRPRALAALGIDAGALVAGRPGMTWLSITGYGRSGPAAGWVAFGDDAAAAAGLVARRAGGSPVFCGDAIADPLTGLQAAWAVVESRRRGGGELVSVAMVDAVRSVLGPLPPGEPPVARPIPGGVDDWTVEVGGSTVPVARPEPLVPSGPAPPFGAHTARVVAELATGGSA